MRTVWAGGGLPLGHPAPGDGVHPCIPRRLPANLGRKARGEHGEGASPAHPPAPVGLESPTAIRPRAGRGAAGVTLSTTTPARPRLGTSLQPHVKPTPKHVGNAVAAAQAESKEKITGQPEVPRDARNAASLLSTLRVIISRAGMRCRAQGCRNGNKFLKKNG